MFQKAGFVKWCKGVQCSICQEFFKTRVFLMTDPHFTCTGLFFHSTDGSDVDSKESSAAENEENVRETGQ